jgi:hypothetical protein
MIHQTQHQHQHAREDEYSAPPINQANNESVDFVASRAIDFISRDFPLAPAECHEEGWATLWYLVRNVIIPIGASPRVPFPTERQFGCSSSCSRSPPRHPPSVLRMRCGGPLKYRTCSQIELQSRLQGLSDAQKIPVLSRLSW